MAPPFSVGRIPTKSLTLLPAEISLVNDDTAEVIDVGPGRPGDEQIAELFEESPENRYFSRNWRH